ncbi:dihydrofolate reductase family protein [Streptomyces harbinensis]|uniref:Dihydrofolate reductase n=1 Tax=Streptomyces harbinensis TaxID=1176198 RepID=A0A1I6PNX8_9ACTN|nr:dihydrofolate reductase family protein [Streptomyces harbinensis]SFS41906.1 Dihydrofolate reductase [Streptomyces harbinensis]
MRSLTYYVAVTLDGFIAAPDGGFGFFPIEPDVTEALLPEYPEAVPVQGRKALGLEDVPNRRFDTVLMGWGTYLPALGEGITSPYPHLEQYVFSRTRTGTDPSVRVTAEDPVTVVRELKRRESDLGIWLCGGGKLAAALRPEIDELVIKRNPIVLGSGIPLFDGPFEPFRFTPVATRAFDSGVSVTRYTRAGADG